MKRKRKITKRADLKQFVALFMALFGFWLILSAQIDFKTIMLGLIIALIIPWLCRRILYVPAVNTPRRAYAIFSLPYAKLGAYLLWLLKELVKANIDVALLVLNPKMPINPQVIKFKKTMDNPVAQTILANSIILTPGTITVDVEDHVFTIHALTKEAALSLAPDAGEGEMPARVAALFEEEVEVKDRWFQKSC